MFPCVRATKLRCYGHITRSTGLAKMILLATAQGKSRKDRQKKRWEDNISEWTGVELGEALQKAEDREEWRICPVIFDAQTVIQTRG